MFYFLKVCDTKLNIFPGQHTPVGGSPAGTRPKEMNVKKAFLRDEMSTAKRVTRGEGDSPERRMF